MGNEVKAKGIWANGELKAYFVKSLNLPNYNFNKVKSKISSFLVLLFDKSKVNKVIFENAVFSKVIKPYFWHSDL